MDKKNWILRLSISLSTKKYSWMNSMTNFTLDTTLVTTLIIETRVPRVSCCWTRVLTKSKGWNKRVEHVPLSEPARNAFITGFEITSNVAIFMSFVDLGAKSYHFFVLRFVYYNCPIHNLVSFLSRSNNLTDLVTQNQLFLVFVMASQSSQYMIHFHQTHT